MVEIEFVGTLRHESFPRNTQGLMLNKYDRKCQCDQCTDPVNMSRKNTGLIVNGETLVNLGGFTDPDLSMAHVLIEKYDSLKAVVFTSNYYMEGLHHLKKNQLNLPVYLSEAIFDSWMLHTGEDLNQWFKHVHLIDLSDGSFEIGDVQFQFQSVYNSFTSRIQALRIDKGVLYVPDYPYMGGEVQKLTNGTNTWIGDGFTLRDDVDFEGFPSGASTGHMSMYNQMAMCETFGVKAMMFTHVGHVEKSHVDLKRNLRRRMKSRHSNLSLVEVVKEGDVYNDNWSVDSVDEETATT